MTTTRPPAATRDGLPIPESLLGPLLDAAAGVLAGLAVDDVPASLRALAGFDRRGLGSATARQQLRRALEVDEDFRELAAVMFVEKPEVTTALARWTPTEALELVEEAAERSDLAWLASALYAARPDGWEFGLGVVVTVVSRQRETRERDDDEKARDAQLRTAQEARRAAEKARDQAQGEQAKATQELRDERRTRRNRDLAVERELAAARGLVAEAEAASAASVRALEQSEARLRREAERARTAEQRARGLQRELEHHREPVPPVVVSAPPAAPVPAPDEVVAPVEPAGPARRTRPTCPPGIRGDSVEGLDAMLRTRGVVLLVDGYNVSMAGWGHVGITEQRDHLVAALERLHLRLRCDVVVVFDGADVPAMMLRHTGVRVRFSPVDESADAVVVAEVHQLPTRVPVLVASSDRWVRDHAEAAGAVGIAADALVQILRR